MIYRPFTDYEGVVAGLWWSNNPFEEYGASNKPAQMNLDKTSISPLTKETRDFIAKFWAVARGRLEEIGDVFQDFLRAILLSASELPRSWNALNQMRMILSLFPMPGLWVVKKGFRKNCIF